MVPGQQEDSIMANKIYKEGFPSDYNMVQRGDETFLIGPYPYGGSYIGDTGIICVAPKFQQGEEWLKTAQMISTSLNRAMLLEEDKEELARQDEGISF